MVATDDSKDALTVTSTDLPLTIKPRAAATEGIDLGQTGSVVGTEITGAVMVDGTDAVSAVLEIHDEGDGANVDTIASSTSIVDPAGAPITFIAPPQGNLAFKPLHVVCLGATGTHDM